MPIVVGEAVLGAVIGPDGLGIARSATMLDFFGQLGLGFLFFFAGYEIRLDRIKGSPVRLAAIGWLMTVVLAYSLAAGLAAANVSSPASSSARR